MNKFLVVAISVLSITLLSHNLNAADKPTTPSVKSKPLQPEPKDPFDRLDGKGPSRMKADVIFWEGRMELRSQPKGKLKEPGFTIDDKNESKKVLVIEYRYEDLPYRIIRRAPLEAKLNEPFKMYRDLKDKTDDHFLLSETPPEGLGFTWEEVPRTFKPARLYPDHYEDASTKEVEPQNSTNPD